MAGCSLIRRLLHFFQNAAFEMFHIFFGELQGAFISGYDTLTCRATITGEAKKSYQFLRAHMDTSCKIFLSLIIYR